MHAAFPHQFSQREIQGVLRIRSVEAMVAITARRLRRAFQRGQVQLLHLPKRRWNIAALARKPAAAA